MNHGQLLHICCMCSAQLEDGGFILNGKRYCYECITDETDKYDAMMQELLNTKNYEEYLKTLY